MIAIWVIARNTFREIIRDRILYGLLVFALLLIGFSLVLGELSFAEQTRISINFGLAGIHLSAVTLSVFIGSTLVSKEIEKQTILTLLARPVTRLQFLIGKCLGLAMVTSAVICGLAMVLLGVIISLSWEWGASYLLALLGILYESLVLLSITILFGMFSKPTLTVSYSIGMFLVGHWIGDLTYFAEKSGSGIFKILAQFVTTVLPDFERFNWRSFVIYNDPISFSQLGIASIYAFAWTTVFIVLAGIIFRRRDFV